MTEGRKAMGVQGRGESCLFCFVVLLLFFFWGGGGLGGCE